MPRSLAACWMLALVAPLAAAGRQDRHGDPLPDGAITRLGTLRHRYGGFAISLAYTPDGRRLVLGSLGGAWVLDVDSGRLVHHLSPGQHGNYRAVACLSPDGRRMAMGAAVHDVETGRRLFELPDANACFSPDGKLLACYGMQMFFTLHDAATGAQLRKFAGHPVKVGESPQIGVNGVVFSADGKTVISAGADGKLRFWEVATGTLNQEVEASSTPVDWLARSPDGALLATLPLAVISKGMNQWQSYRGATLRVWDARSGKLLSQAEVPSGAPGYGPRSVAFTPDGQELWTWGIDNVVRAWDPRTGKERRRVADDLGFGGPLAFSPDGKTVAAVDGQGIRFLDRATGRPQPRDDGPRQAAQVLALSPDGRIVATAIDDKTIGLWDTRTGAELRRWTSRGEALRALLFAADGRLLCALDAGNVLRVWDPRTGHELRQHRSEAKTNGLLAVSPDGQTLAWKNSGQQILLLEPATGKELRRLDCEADQFAELVFTADGRTLRGRAHKEIHVWDLASGQPRRQVVEGAPDFFYAIAVAPDGRQAAFVGVEQLATPFFRFYDLEASQPPRPIEPGPDQRSYGVQGAAYSPDGRMLAWVGMGDNIVRLTETATGKERGRLTGHSAGVQALAFSADGATLVSGASDTTALVWDVYGRAEVSQVLDARALADCWDALQQADAAPAYQALRRLVADPERAAPYLGKLLRPAPPADKQVTARLIADLDSERFAVREEAARQMERLGEAALAALRHALAGNLSLEARQRVRRLIEKLEPGTGARLRVLRAVEALEFMNARPVLQELAQAAAGTLPTDEARTALARLERRATTKGVFRE